MAWDNYDVRVDYTSEDGDFQIVEGDFNGEHRYGMRWTHWNYGAPLVIPPLFDDDIDVQAETAIMQIISAVQSETVIG